MSSVKEYYDSHDYRKIIEKLPEQFKIILSLEEQFLQEYIQENKNILEIDCGQGRTIDILIKKANHITGIDISQKSLDAIRPRNNLTTYIMNAANLHFEKEIFDYVLCLGSTLSNIKKAKRAIQEMKRVCKKDGEIILNVINEDSKEFHEQVYSNNKLTITYNKNNIIRLQEGLYSKRFTRKEITNLFEENNLSYTITKPTPYNYLLIGKK